MFTIRRKLSQLFPNPRRQRSLEEVLICLELIQVQTTFFHPWSTIDDGGGGDKVQSTSFTIFKLMLIWKMLILIKIYENFRLCVFFLFFVYFLCK